MILLTALRLSVSAVAPCHSAGYSIAPTPMIVPWPAISRGTEWIVPMVPGLVRRDRGAREVVDGQLAAARLADDVLVGGPELAKSISSVALMHGTSSGRVPSGLGGRWRCRG